MKSFAIGVLALAAVAQAQNFFEAIQADGNVVQVTDAPSPVSQSVMKNKFGCLVEESVYEHPYVEKTISAPLVPFHMDYA
mgnify:CR=1 FL=1